MGYHREDVVERALRALDDYGLESLTMRRLAAEMGVHPGALYHHVANKQTLLAAVADEILARGRRPRRARVWDRRVLEVCRELRDALLAYRDGVEVVATAWAFGLGAAGPLGELTAILVEAGFGDDLAGAAAQAVWRLVLDYTGEEQTALQASSAGAITDPPRDRSDLDLGLNLVLDGLRARSAGQVHAWPDRADPQQR